MARPTKYKEEMCDQALTLMKEGASIVEVCAEIGIGKSTLYDWCNPEHPSFVPEFSDTINAGMLFCQAWWEKQGRKNLLTKEFQGNTWFINMRNRFHGDKWDTTWKDKKHIDAEVETKPQTFDIGGQEIEFH